MRLLERRVAASADLDTHTFPQRRALVAAKECDLKWPRPNATHAPAVVANTAARSSSKGGALFQIFSVFLLENAN